ncbi:hypothetical protein JA1_004807 [Spathaspora sp. JA1]|nr:hypothetical protein JA1_004807 [Spathaspora sp. JA1]
MFLLKFSKSRKCPKLNLGSLPPETILEIFSYLNKFDVMNIRRLNKKLNQIGSIKLFSSIYVYLPEFASAEYGISRRKTIYRSFFIKYTSVSGCNNFKKLLDLKKMNLVKNVILKIENPSEYSDYCYNYLIQNCTWINVGVDGYSLNMFEKQFARLDKISQLCVRSDFLFTDDIKDNYSIKELYITGSALNMSDPIALIPKLKGLTLLYVDDDWEKDILGHFNRWKISGLKLKALALRVTELSLERMNEVFVLDEIVSFELHFYNNLSPYEGLEWLCSRMKKLRRIHISWPEVSFEKVMQQLSVHRLYHIRIDNHGGRDKKITASEIKQLLRGHDSVVRFRIGIGPTVCVGLADREIMIRASYGGFKTLNYNYKKKKFPKTQIEVVHRYV